MKRHKKIGSLFATATAFTVVASAMVPTVVNAAQLTDIKGNTHEDAIKALIEMRLISGYPDNTFKPNKELTRSDVVKIIGKYLVANGYKIPGDYKKKMRFTDLSSSSNDELLQYAALVKDVGIFTGDNGKLNPSGKMTRENMAVVLVNALAAVHQLNYVTYVEKQNFSKEIVDINDSKESARSAINVLDYFDITQVHNFKPKDFITRGQFTSFLYKIANLNIPALSVESVEVLSANQLSVTLSNQTIHTVTLSESLKENINTTVRFEINNTSFTANVTYEGGNVDPDKEATDFDSFKVESDELLFAVTPDGRFTEKDDATIKVFGLIGNLEVEIHNAVGKGFNVSTESKYLNTDGNQVTANVEAIQADGILDDKTDRYEAEILVTINETGETIKHTITLAREDAVVKSNFELIDKRSLSEKLLEDIEIDITTEDTALITSELFAEILEEGFFEIEDQYGNDAVFNNGIVTFFDGTTKNIRLTISEIDSENDKNVVTSNGSSPTIKLGAGGLAEGDTFDLTLTVNSKYQTIKVYLK